MPHIVCVIDDVVFVPQYLFYLDQNNVINDLVNEKGQWKPGDLKNLAVKAAHYSKLAAITVQESGNGIIYVYYQPRELSGHIYVVGRHNGKWHLDGQLQDKSADHPPLFGTSLAAVYSASSASTSKQSEPTPVLFLQEKNLELATLDGKGMVSPPPSTLTFYYGLWKA